MVELVSAVPLWAGIMAAMALTAGLGVLVYRASERLIPTTADETARRVGGLLFPTVAILVSLMLSLAFGDVVNEWRSAQDAISRESTAISDVLKALEAFDTSGSADAKAALLDYADSVVEADWPALENDTLSPEADLAFQQVVTQVLGLSTNTVEQVERRARMADDLDSISDARQARLVAAVAEPPVYFFVILLGFLITMVILGALFEPQPLVIGLSMLYASFVGLVLYLILAMSDPLHGGLNIEPRQLEHLISLQSTG